MSEQPVAGDAGTAEQTAAVAEQLQGQAAGVAGTDSAGIYGDPAGASQHSAPQTEQQVATELAAKGGAATSVDTEALLKQVQQMAEQLARLQAAQTDAASAAALAEPKPPVLDEVLTALSGVSPGIVHAIVLVGERLTAIEEHLFGSPSQEQAQA